MRKLILVLLGYLIAVNALAQNSQGLFTGTPNITVPLTEAKTGNITIPIYLSYNATGNKVEDIASNVGLGWTLNTGGSIKRIVRGIPDDYNRNDINNKGLGWLHEINEDSEWISGGEFLFYKPAVHCDMSEYIDHYNPYEKSEVANWEVFKVFEGYWLDTEPDQFLFSLPGKNGEFYFDKDGNIRSVNGWTLEFSYVLDANKNISQFNIVDDDGTEYIFGTVDKKTVTIERDKNIEFLYGGVQGFGVPMSIENLTTTSNDVWKLTKVITQEGLEINYNYELETHSIETNLPTYKTGNDTEEENAYEVFDISVSSNRLTQISTDNYEINFYKGSNRLDLTGSYYISDIKIYWKSPRKFVKGIDLTQSYFISPGVSTSDGKRLKLESVKEYSLSGAKPPYNFYYNETDRLPSRLSKEQDLWGYYNNNGATTLIPEIHVYLDASSQHDRYRAIPIPGYSGAQHYAISGADRTPDIRIVSSKIETVMDALILERIDYPEGGYINFEYEPHEYLYKGDTYRGGGLRIAKTILHDGSSDSEEQVKEFSYLNEGSITSGRLLNKPIYAYLYYEIGDASAEDRVSNDYLADRNNYFQKYLRVTSTCNTNLIEAPIVYENVEIIGRNGNVRYTFEVNSLFEDFSAPFKTTATHNLVVESGDSRVCFTTQEKWNCQYYVSPTPEIGRDNFPFPANENCKWKRGLIDKIEIFDVNNSLKKEIVYSYLTHYKSNGQVNYIKGLKFSRTNHPTENKECGMCWIPLPVPHFEPYCGICENGNPQFVYGYYKIATGVSKLLSSKTEKVYNSDESGNFIETTTNYTYNNFGQIESIYKDDSHGDEIKTRYQYPKDYYTPWVAAFNTEALAIDRMKTRNIINNPIEEINYKNSKVTSATLNAYKWDSDREMVLPYYTANLKITEPLAEGDGTNLFTPSEIKKISFGNWDFLKDNHYTTDLGYNKFDDYGNLLQYHKINDVNESFIWGYNGQYPIAKTINATYNDIYFTSFEDEPSIRTWHPQPVFDNSKAKTGKTSLKIVNSGSDEYYYFLPFRYISNSEAKTYKFSAWVYSEGPSVDLVFFFKPDITDEIYSAGYQVEEVKTNETGKWVYMKGNAVVPPEMKSIFLRIDNNGGGTVWFDDLKFWEENARMTTYTYDPLIGMTSATGPDNKKTTYEYDDFGRLEFIKDHNDDVVKKYTYHYKGDPTDEVTEDFIDLSVYTLVSPLTVYDNETSINIDVGINNSGNLVSNNCKLSIYISDDSNLDAGDIMLAEEEIYPLSNAYNVIYSINVTLPTELNLGTHYLIAKVDSDNQNDESDESNNTKYATFNYEQEQTEILEVSTTSMTFNSDGNPQSFDITSNISWTITADAWLEILPVSSGSGDQSITVTCINFPEYDRLGIITVSGGGITKTIHVTQLGTGGSGPV